MAEAYRRSPCDTFCIVRHPYERLLSAWQHSGSLEPYDVWATETLKALKQDEGALDCSLRPQVDYIFAYPGNLSGRVCTNVLRIEDLRVDFNELAEIYSLAFRMENGHEESPGVLAPIAKRTDLPPQVLEGVKSFYAKDFEALDYGFG